MEKEAKYLSVAFVTGIVNRHSVHLLTPWQLFCVHDVTVTAAVAEGLWDGSYGTALTGQALCSVLCAQGTQDLVRCLQNFDWYAQSS